MMILILDIRVVRIYIKSKPSINMSKVLSKKSSPRVRRTHKKSGLVPVDPVESYKVVEHIYKAEEHRQRSLLRVRDRQLTQKETLAAEIRQVISQLTETLSAKSDKNKKLRPLPEDLSPGAVFKESAVDIEDGLEPQEKMSKFGGDPNAFFVYKQRSGFIKISSCSNAEPPTISSRSPPKRRAGVVAIKGTIQSLIEDSLPLVSKRASLPTDIQHINPVAIIAEEGLPPLNLHSSPKARRVHKIALPHWMRRRMKNNSSLDSAVEGSGEIGMFEDLGKGKRGMKALVALKRVCDQSKSPVNKSLHARDNSRRVHNISTLTSDRQGNVSKLDSFIEDCRKEEKAAGEHIRTSENELRMAKAVADNYRKVSKKVEEIGCAHPEALKQMFFEKVNEERELRAEMEAIVFNYRNSPGDRKGYNMLYPSAKRYGVKRKGKESAS